MELTGVRACDLSRKLHVDRSLIGKWKNGVRPIPARSYYWDGIIECFTETTFQQKQIDDFFENVIGCDYSSKLREKHIMHYLFSDELSNELQSNQKEINLECLYKSNIYVYKALNGRKKAFRNFLDYAINFHGKTLLLHDSINFSWIFDDSIYFEQIQKLLCTFLENNRIQLIVSILDDHKSVSNLINFLFLYASKKEVTCYYFMPSGAASYISTYVLTEEMALLGYCEENDWNKTYTQISTDLLTVLQYQNIFSQIINVSHSFKSENMRSLCDFKDYVIRFSSISETIYSFLPTISLFSMEEDLLDKVLTYNELSSDQIAQIHSYRQIFIDEVYYSAKQKNTKLYFIHDYNTLKFMKERDYVMYSDNVFSHIPTIQVRQDDYRTHLASIVKTLENSENIEIGILKNHFDYQNVVSNTGFRICKKKCWFIGAIQDQTVFANDKYMVHLQYKATEHMWNSIPTLLKTKAEVIQLLLE